jgi:hypothetical protein
MGCVIYRTAILRGEIRFAVGTLPETVPAVDGQAGRVVSRGGVRVSEVSN